MTPGHGDPDAVLKGKRTLKVAHAPCIILYHSHFIRTIHKRKTKASETTICFLKSAPWDSWANSCALSITNKASRDIYCLESLGTVQNSCAAQQLRVIAGALQTLKRPTTLYFRTKILKSRTQ